MIDSFFLMLIFHIFIFSKNNIETDRQVIVINIALLKCIKFTCTGGIFFPAQFQVKFFVAETL